MRALAIPLLSAALMGQDAPAPRTLELPAPKVGSFALDAALRQRHSDRNLSGPALSLETLSQLLWSAQGETRPPAREGRPAGRTAPSASAGYPLELYVAVADGDELAAGVYKYSPRGHSLTKIKDGAPEVVFDFIKGQTWVLKCPAIFIFSGFSPRMPGNDPIRKELFTHWESGAAAQSLCLQVTACGLGATVVAGVDLEALRAAAGIPSEERVSVIVPVGRPAQ